MHIDTDKLFSNDMTNTATLPQASASVANGLTLITSPTRNDTDTSARSESTTENTAPTFHMRQKSWLGMVQQ